MIIFRALHSEAKMYFKNNIFSFGTSSFKWQKMFVNSKEMQAFRAFLSQLRRFLCSSALHRCCSTFQGWLGGLVEVVACSVSDLHMVCHPGAHRHLWLWAAAHQLSNWHLYRPGGRSRFCWGCSLVLAPEVSTGCWFFIRNLETGLWGPS